MAHKGSKFERSHEEKHKFKHEKLFVWEDVSKDSGCWFYVGSEAQFILIKLDDPDSRDTKIILREITTYETKFNST